MCRAGAGVTGAVQGQKMGKGVRTWCAWLVCKDTVELCCTSVGQKYVSGTEGKGADRHSHRDVDSC